MKRDDLDALLGKINSLIDEGRPVTEPDGSVGVGTGTYEAPQGISLRWDEDDTP